MDYTHIASKIIRLRDEDLNLREMLISKGQLSEGYNKEMEELHNRNAQIMHEIIDTIGYPTIDKVGKEANEATWLIIQHSIGRPEFMKRCRDLLEEDVRANKASQRELAYLTDRISVLEGKPQLYGTQFDWDEHGELRPNLFDDLAKVNQRRKSIGLTTLEEQTLIIRKRAKEENQSPPMDLERRREDMDEWRKRVGWIE